MKFVFSPDVFLCGWLGSKPQLTNHTYSDFEGNVNMLFCPSSFCTTRCKQARPVIARNDHVEK